jgi:hypothetical protein
MHVSIHPHRRLHWLLYLLLALLAILLLADTASAQVGRRWRRLAGVAATARANAPVGPGVGVGPSVPMPPPPLGFFGFPPGMRPPFMFSRIRTRPAEVAPTAQATKKAQSASAKPAAVKSERESPEVLAEELPPGELLPAAPGEPISNVKPAKVKRGAEF